MLRLSRWRLPLLITGVAGVAGYNAFHYFRTRYPGRVIGIRPQQSWRLADPGIVACDMEDAEELARLFDRHAFGSVLNCAGNCALRACELDPPLAWRTNVSGVEQLVRQLAGSEVRLVHLSIDLVFSGASGQGGYRETDPTDPVTVYGQTMVAAEQCVLGQLPDACVLRISLPMGISFNGHAGAIDWIQSRFKKSRPATLYFDEVRTPTYTDCMNPLYERLLESRLAGLFHGGGPRRMSLYQIAQVINKVGGYDPQLLIGCPRIDAGPVPPRAGNVTLDSSKLIAALGENPFDPWPHQDMLAPTDRGWHFERDRDWPGSREFLRRVLYCNPSRPGPQGLPVPQRAGRATG